MRTFASLAEPNYRAWFFSQMISMSGTWMQTTAMGFLMYELTHSAVWLGGVAFAGGAAAWIFTLYGGNVADRVPRKTILLWTQWLSLGLALLLTLLCLLDLIAPWHLLVVALAVGIVNAFDGPARHAFAPDLVSAAHLPNAVALNSTLFNAGIALGPAISGFVYVAAGPAACFALNALSFLAVITALSIMRNLPALRVKPPQNPLVEIAAGLSYAKNHPTIAPLMALIATCGAFGLSIFSLMPAWSVQVLHGGARLNGALMSARGVGALAGALMLASLHPDLRRLIFVRGGALLFPLFLIAFSFTTAALPSLIFLALCACALIVLNNQSSLIMQQQVAPEYRGRIMSMYMVLLTGTIPIGSMLGGLAIARFGAHAAMAGLGSAALVAGGVILSLSSGLREKPAAHS